MALPDYQHIEPASCPWMLVPHELSQDALIGALTQPILVVPVNIYNIYYVLEGELFVDLEGITRLIEEQGKRLEVQIAGLGDKISSRLDALDQRFIEVDRRFSSIETQLNMINSQRERFETKVDKIRDQFHSLDIRVWIVMAVLLLVAGAAGFNVFKLLALAPK